MFQGLESLARMKRRLLNHNLSVSRYDDMRLMAGQLKHLPQDVFRCAKDRSEYSLSDSVLAVHNKWEQEQEDASTSHESIVYR